MPAPAENALEIGEKSFLLCERHILVNQEINATCRFTKSCGTNCILAQTNSGAKKPLSQEETLEIATELVCGKQSSLIRHYCLAGKEPFETPDLLLSISKIWHSTSFDKKCGTIGAITASASGVETLTRKLADSPLSWLLGSMDIPTTGLRTDSNNLLLLRALMEARQCGAIDAFGINTLITDHNLEAVIRIGRMVSRSSANQWSIGSLLQPLNGLMSSTVSLNSFENLISRLAAEEEFRDGPMQITIDVDFETLVHLVNDPARFRTGKGSWRFEYPITASIRLIALNPFPFLRIRWDGEMLGMRDFMTVGLRSGSHGRYEQGRASEVLGRIEAHRLSQSVEPVIAP